ncbi:MAG TPA: LPXTG cell wall anchor domain-containing protein [Chitinophagaceae bacterium]|nr:LPXTG cell wall anchor domain-containing protein [Chitinophagaceae bacterium]
MLKFLLDVAPEPTFTERAKNHNWLIIVALVALAGLVVFFILKRRNTNKG